MKKLIQVQDNKHLARDLDSKAIINTNREAFLSYKAAKHAVRNEKQQLNNKIDYLENELSELKTLINQLIKKDNK